MKYRQLSKVSSTQIYSCSLRILAISSLIAITGNTIAANTSGVHGPNVDPDDKSMQVRIGLAPADTDSQVDQWAYRYHYQQAFNDKLRARLVAQYRDRGDVEYDFFRAELLYNFKKAVDSNWSSGLRFELRTRRGSRAEEFGLHWTNQWDFDNGYRMRAIAVGIQEFGANRTTSKLAMAARSGLSKKINKDIRLGVEMFNSFGELGDFSSFNEQSHQIGPTIAGNIVGFKYQFRWLRGLSDASRNNNFELRFDKSF